MKSKMTFYCHILAAVCFSISTILFLFSSAPYLSGIHLCLAAVNAYLAFIQKKDRKQEP